MLHENLANCSNCFFSFGPILKNSIVGCANEKKLCAQLNNVITDMNFNPFTNIYKNVFL